MNWVVALIVGWLLAGIQVGLDRTLALGGGAITPSLLLPFAVFIALNAPPQHALWSALALGAATDLLWSVPLKDGSAASVLGPHALGFALAAQLVLTLRGSVMRRNPIVLGLLSLAGAAVCGVLVTALMTFRDLYDPFAWRAQSELFARLGSAVYTGIAGVLAGLVLLPLTQLFSFPSTLPGRRPAMRRV